MRLQRWLMIPLLLLSGVASAQHYFVSPQAKPGGSGKSAAEALSSIQRALQLSHPGDTVVIGSGHYYESLQSVRSGEPRRPISIQAYPDAVLHGGSRNRVFEINHSYIELNGLTIDGHHSEGEGIEACRDKLIYIDGHKHGIKQVVMRGLRLKNAYGECLRIKGNAVGTELAYSTIENCGLRDFRFGRGKKNGEAIYIGTAPEQLKNYADHSNSNWIHHNIIVVGGSECVDIKEGSVRNRIEYNLCDQANDPDSGGVSLRGNYNTVRYNTIINGAGVAVRMGGDTADQGVYNRVEKNHIENNRAGAIKIMRSPQLALCGNKIHHSAKTKVVRRGSQVRDKINPSCDMSKWSSK